MFIRSVWSDKRLLFALPVAIFLRLMMDVAMGGGWQAPPAESSGLHPTNPEAVAAPAPGNALLLERRIKKINLDGSERLDPMSPFAAAAAFGGAILLVGGALSILSWRNALRDERTVSSEPDPVARNAGKSLPR